MKPILEWYEQLPEPYRSQAIENYDPKLAEWMNGMSDSQSDAISHGFNWEKTTEGEYYWNEICNRAERGEFDTPVWIGSGNIR